MVCEGGVGAGLMGKFGNNALMAAQVVMAHYGLAGGAALESFVLQAALERATAATAAVAARRRVAVVISLRGRQEPGGCRASRFLVPSGNSRR